MLIPLFRRSFLSLKNAQKKTCHFASPTKSASRGMVYILNFIYYIKILLIYPTYTPPKFPRSYAHIPHILYQKSSKFFDANFDEPLVKSAFSTHHTPSTQAQNLSKIFSNPLILAVFHRSLDFFLNFSPIKQTFISIDHTSIKRHLALSYHKKRQILHLSIIPSFALQPLYFLGFLHTPTFTSLYFIPIEIICLYLVIETPSLNLNDKEKIEKIRRNNTKNQISLPSSPINPLPTAYCTLFYIFFVT